MKNLLRLTIILIPHLIIFAAFGQHHVAIKTNVSTAQLLRCEVKDGVLTETFEVLASADNAGMISWSHDKFSKKWRSVCITAENFKTITRQLEKLDFQEFEVKLYHTKAYLTQRKKDLSRHPGVINYSLFLEECFDDPDWESNYHIYLRKKAIFGRTELSSIVKSANEINDICEGLDEFKTQLAVPLNEFPLGNAPPSYTTLIQEISVFRKDLDSWDVLSEIQLPTFNHGGHEPSLEGQPTQQLNQTHIAYQITRQKIIDFYGGGLLGGYYNGTYRNATEYITIASTGNGTDFGDLTASRRYMAGVNSSTRGVIGGGENDGGSEVNIIEYITIASDGDGTEFQVTEDDLPQLDTSYDSVVVVIGIPVIPKSKLET